MPLFKRSKPSSQPRFPASAEHLVHPAYTPPPLGPNPSDFSDRDSRFTDEETLHLPPGSLHRSQSQRQPHQLRDRPAVSAPAPGPEDPQPRRLKKGLFVRPPSGFLDRSASVKNKPISNPISQPTSPRWPPPLAIDQDGTPYAYEDQSPTSAKPYDPRPTSLAPQQLHQPHPRDLGPLGPRQGHPAFSNDPPERPQLQLQLQPQPQPSQQQRPPTQTPPPVRAVTERPDTDPARLDQYTQASTDAVPESPHHAPEHGQRGQPHPCSQQDLVLNARPPSRQTYEPLSPVQTQTHPDAMQQASAQAQQPPPPPPPTDRPSETPQASRRGSTVQNMPEPGRQTPTNNRARDETSDLDVRALIQKHDELRMCLSFLVLSRPFITNRSPC